MSDTDTPDDTATFGKGGSGKGSSGGKSGKSGHGSSGHGELSGGHWATIGHHRVYLSGPPGHKGGKVLAGGFPGITHDRHGSPLGPARPAGDHPSIPVKGKAGKHVDRTPARDVERERDEAKSRQDYRKAGAAHAKAKADHAAAKKALADHDAIVKHGPAKIGGLEAKRDAIRAKLAGLKAKLAEHEAAHAAKPGKPEGLADRIARKSAQAKANQAADRKAHADRADRALADAEHARATSRAARTSRQAKDYYAAQKAEDAAHAAKAAPAGSAPAAHRTVKSSAPRDARESAVHAHATARGKSAMVVTATPTYHAAHSGGKSAYHVGGRHVASHHVDEKGRHVVTTHHRNGTTTTIRHNTKESAKRHLEAYVKHRIARGTTRHAVVGDHGKLSSFDHRKHGIGGAHHRVTGRVLGDGGHVKFNDDVIMGVDGDLVTFRGGGAKGAAKAPGKSPSSKSTGLRWVTIRGHAVQVDGSGTIVKGGVPGLTHDLGSSRAHSGPEHAAHTAPGRSRAAAHKTARSHAAELHEAGKGDTDEGRAATARVHETKPPARSSSIKARVAAHHAETSRDKTERATGHLKTLHAETAAGKHDRASHDGHVDRIARGATKGELFDAAHHAGIKHGATTKKALVEHLKGLHAGHAAKPAGTGKAGPAGSGPPAAPAGAAAKSPVRPATPAKSSGPGPVSSPGKPAPPAGPALEHSRATFDAKKSGKVTQAAAEAHASRLIGKDVKFHEVASMVGAPDDARVHVSKVTDRSLEVTTEGKGYFSVRVIHRGADGRPFIENHFSEVTAQGKGTGTQVFGNQVAHATAHGIDRIEMVAARSFKADGSDSLVGYKVWPKFGFDAPIHEQTRERLPRSLRKARNVSDLMKTGEGRAFWAEKGGGIAATFDLKAGSNSHKVWDAYKAARAAKGAA